MISYAQSMVEYFRYSRQFYYLILDPKGNYSYVNPLFQEKFSHLSSEFTGTSLTVFNSPDHLRFDEALRQSINNLSCAITLKTAFKDANGFLQHIQWEISATTDE